MPLKKPKSRASRSFEFWRASLPRIEPPDCLNMGLLSSACQSSRVQLSLCRSRLYLMLQHKPLYGSIRPSATLLSVFRPTPSPVVSRVPKKPYNTAFTHFPKPQ